MLSGLNTYLNNANSTKYLALSFEATAQGNYVAAEPWIVSYIDFSSVYGTSTTFHGHIVTDIPAAVSLTNIASFFTKPLAGTGLTDLEFFFAAALEGVGGTTLTGKYICWKLLGY